MTGKAIFLLVIILSSGSWCQAGERQAERIEQLEQENYHLSMEISRLRQQMVQMQKLEQYRRQACQSYRPPYSYGSGPLRQGTQQLRDWNQFKRELENSRR